MPKRSKAYRAAVAKIEEKSHYTLSEAIALLKETSAVKFDASAEIHFNLNLNPKKQDQLLRGTLILPHGSGKTYKIAAVVEDGQVKAAKDAGAAAAGLEDLIEEFKKGKINYDVVIATPKTMKSLGKVAKILGQKGMMPNPKSGTVTDDVVKAIEELKKGRIEYRTDKEGNVHNTFGKVSFKAEDLESNARALAKAIRDNKPVGAKGTYVKSIFLASTMGPGIPVDASELMGNL